MKQFTVTWWQAAEDELARLWASSPIRSQITEASREIDALLSAQPTAVGDEVSEGLFALEVEPLRVQFSIEHDDRVVRVWTVRLTNP